MKTSFFFPFARILSVFGLLTALATVSLAQTGGTNTAIPVVSVQVTDASASEAGDPGQFKLVREGPTNSALYLFYVLGGTASNAVDYAALQSVAVIPAGSRAVEIPIVPIDDKLVEGPETVELRLAYPLTMPPINYVIGVHSNGVVTIADNDPAPPLTNHPPSVRIFTPTNNATFSAPANIFIGAQAYDPDAGDSVTNVEFFAGTNDLGPANLVVLDPPGVNGVVGPVYVLNWSNVPAGEYFLQARATDTHGAVGSSETRRVLVGVLPQPVVTIQATDPQAVEPGAGAVNPGVFRFSRTGPTNDDLLVYYSIHGSASNGVDYATISNAVIIPAGHSATELVINPLADTLTEGVETVELSLVTQACIAIFPPPPGCYLVGNPNAAAVYIADSNTVPTNRPPSVGIVTPTNNATFSAPANILIVAQAYDPDTNDYVVTVEFFAGTNSLGVTTNNPLSAQPANPFMLTWSNVPPGEYFLQAKATDSHGATRLSETRRVLVGVPPQPVVTIQASDPQASEPGLGAINPGVFRISRTGPTNEDLLVYLSIHGSASNGVDYAVISNAVVIPAGRLAVELVINPLTDTLPEGVETVELGLEPLACIAIFPPPPGCYLIGNPNAAVVYIADNNTVPTNRLPEVHITQPLNDDKFLLPTNVTIIADTVDADGYVWKVEFFVGDHKIGEEQKQFIIPPTNGTHISYEFVWTNPPPGHPTLYARATDNQGAVSWSGPVGIWIGTTNVPPITNRPPVAYLVSPKNGAVFVSPVNITLIAEAVDSDGQVTNVDFFAGDHFLGSDNTGTSNHYSIVWSNVAPGIYNLRARATDDDGAKGSSLPITITVLSTNRPPETNHPPVITISARDGLAAEGTNHWLSPSNTVPASYPDGTNTATFVVRRDGPTNTSLVVNYSISGTASNGVDYLTLPGTVNIPAGSRYALIVIKPVDDNLPECSETVILNLKPNTNSPNISYVIGWPERAGAIILDNDTPPPGTQLLCDGTFQIGKAAVNGTGYRIEVTTDMTNWIPISTNPVVDGGIYFTDPETSDSSTRFYRTVTTETIPVE